MLKIKNEELKKAKDLLRFAKEVNLLDISLIIYFLEQYCFAYSQKDNGTIKDMYFLFYLIAIFLKSKITEQKQLASAEVERMQETLQKQEDDKLAKTLKI